MARFDEIYKKYKEQKQNGTEFFGAGTSASGNAQAVAAPTRKPSVTDSYQATGRFAQILEKAKTNGVRFTGVDDAYVQSFLTDAQAFVKKSHQDGKSLTWEGATNQQQYDSRLQTMQDLSSRADAIRVYLNANKGSMDKKAYETLSGLLKDFDSDKQTIYNAFRKQKEYFSQFDSQEAYDFHEAHSTPEKRREWYKGLEKRKKELEAQKEQEAAAWQETEANANSYDGFEYSEMEEAHWNKLKAIEEEINKIGTEMRQYERGGYNEKGQHYGSKVIDDAAGIMAKEDFAEKSGDPDYSAMSQKELFDLQMQEVWNGWEDLTEDETKVFNYLWNTEGKEAALEYRDDLQREKNRVAAEKRTQTMQKQYQEADIGGKILMNIVSVPANVAGGTVAFASDVGKILSGEEIDPNNAAHGLMDYGAAVRQQTAGALDETGLKIPGIDFTLGDAYQAGMSMLDSLVSVGIGRKLGGILLATGAASSEAKRLYNQGASTEQIGWGAALAGAAELVFEEISIDKLIKMKDASSVKEFVKNALVQGGVEASEEAVTEIVNTLTNAIVMGGESDWQKLLKEHNGDEVQALLEKAKEVTKAGLGGFLSGAGSGAVVGTVKYATNKLTGNLTDNEKAVVQLEYENRLKEAQKDKKLTKAEQTKLYNAVVEDLKNGEISTDVIEEALGGDQYQSYREAYDQEESRRKALEDELAQLKDADNTVGNAKRYDQVAAELEQLKKDSKVQEQKTALGQAVADMAKADRLSESYAEKGRRSETFQADLSQYDEKQRATVQAAMDSGILNNTRRTHKFVELLAKIGAEKGLAFDFTTNQRLKESGFAIEGATVNGYLTKNGVTINVNSAKALNSVVGHEITHVLEGTALYGQLAEMLESYAKSRGEYDSRMESLRKLYAKVEGFTGEGAEAKLRQELVADLVGDYLFTDKAFVEKLSTENRNLFRKLWDEVKYLCRMATVGSKELRQLEKVKKTFEDVYRTETKKPTESGGVRYSLASNAKTELHKALYDTKYREDVRLRDETPAIMLGHKGVENLPMAMKASHIRENVFTEDEARKLGLRVDENTHYHGLGEDLFLQVIDGLDNVKEAYRGTKNASDPTRREDYFLLVSEFSDKDGNTINVPVYINRHAQINRVFVDVNKISTVYGKEALRDYITRQVKNQNLVRIKRKSTESSERAAHMAAGYRNDASTDSIREPTLDVNNKNSLSENVAGGEGLAPLPWEIRGEDVSIGGVAWPTREDIDRMETGEPAQGAETEAEGVAEDFATKDLEGEEDYEETAEDRLDIRKRRLQWQVRQNKTHREELTQRLEAEINALREEYEGLQNKNTKKASQLLRRIDNKSGQLRQQQAEYDKTIRNLQERIGKVEEKLKQDHTAENRLEKAYRKIDAEYKQQEMELATEYAKKRYQMKTEIENHGKWISDAAYDLYWQMSMHKKGDKLSERLKTLIRTGKDWLDIKYALEDIKDSPEAYSKNPTEAEVLVRDILEREYEAKQAEVTALEDDFNANISALQKEKEAKRKKATVAWKRKESRSKYLYEVAKIAGDISGWKDYKSGLSYKTKTLQRYLQHVVRTPEGQRDPEKAKALYEYTQGSYNHMEAEMKRELNEKFDKIAALKINPQESTYIQLLGEYRQGGKDMAKTAVTKAMVESYYAEHADKIDTEKVEKALKIARADYDDVFARANEVLREHGMEELKYVLGYFPHMKQIHQTWWQKALNIQPKEEKARSTAVAGKTGAFRPNKKQQGFSKERSGPETEYDFLRGYEQYMTGALDWIYHIPDIQRMKAMENYIRITSAQENEVLAKKIKEIQESDAYNADEEQLQLDLIFQSDTKNNLSNLVIDLMNRTNNLAGKRTSGDRLMEEWTSADAADVLKRIAGRNAANLVAGSLSAGLSNFLSMTRAIGGTTLRNAGRAIWDYTFHNKEVNMVDKSDFLTNRLKNPEKLRKDFWDKTSDVISVVSNWTDNFTARVIWDSRYKDNVDMGMDEAAAIKDADAFAESVMAGRSRGNMPTLFNSKNIVAKCFTTCQLEVANDFGYLFEDLPRDERIKNTNKLAAAYTKVAIGTFLLSQLFYEPLTGRNPGFDPLGMVVDLIFGLADDEEEPEEAVLDFLEEGLQNIPFAGGLFGGGRVPLSSAMPYDGNILDAAEGITKAFTEPDWKNVFRSIWEGNWEGIKKESQEGDWMSLLDELSNPLYYLVSPVGGGQLRKTFQGSVGLYAGKEHPGNYTEDGGLRYPVETDPLSVLQNALFGRWSSQNAQQYLDEGRRPLTEKQTKEFFESGMTIQQYWDYRDELGKLKKQDEKLALINGMDLSDAQKRVLKSYLFDEEGYAKDNPEKYAFLEEEGIGYLGWKELPDDEQEAWSWAFKHQDEYRHYKKNGVLPGDYTTYQVPMLEFKDEANQAYEWEYNYPDKAVMGDVFEDGVVEYRKYIKAMSEIEGDKDANGKTISGSREKKVVAYIEGLDIDGGMKNILRKIEYSGWHGKDWEIVEYLNNRTDMSVTQIVNILEQMGAKVREDGTVIWN